MTDIQITGGNVFRENQTIASFFGLKSFTCSQHDRRVAVVGAADDGSDDHRAVGQLVLLTTVQERDAGLLLLLGDVEAFETHLLIKTTLKVLFHAADCHSILRPFGSAHIGHHGAQVDFNHLRKETRLFNSLCHTIQTLCFCKCGHGEAFPIIFIMISGIINPSKGKYIHFLRHNISSVVRQFSSDSGV